VSRAVNSEFVKRRSHVRAAFRYFAPCIRTVRRCVQSGNRSGTRSWIIVARTPPACGGYIQSEKWSTSNCPTIRSAGGLPARLQAVRQACANGSVGRRRSTSIPSSAASIAARPSRLAGAQATISCSPPAASTRPPSDPST